MPNGWIHQALDLYCFGKIFWSTHEYKDSPSGHIPGKKHRILRHTEWKEWQSVGREFGWLESKKEIQNIIDLLSQLIKFRNVGKYPKTAPNTEHLASIGHELLDYMWDDLDATSRYFVALLVKHDILKPSENSFFISKETQVGPDYAKLSIKLKKQSLSRYKKKLPTEVQDILDRLSNINQSEKIDEDYFKYKGKRTFIELLDEFGLESKEISTEVYFPVMEVLNSLKPHLAEVSQKEQEDACKALYLIHSFAHSALLAQGLFLALNYISSAITLLKGSEQGFVPIINYFKSKSSELEKLGIFPELSSELTKLTNQMQKETDAL